MASGFLLNYSRDEHRITEVYSTLQEVQIEKESKTGSIFKRYTRMMFSLFYARAQNTDTKSSSFAYV